ncbi:MAG: 4Fe-4S binding protein [Desulfobacteraceae bacterium]
MDANDKVYVQLQKHLDEQTFGYPATKSGVEMRLLKHFFSPREAMLATCLTYKFEPMERVFERARHLVGSMEELEEQLDGMEKKGCIELKTKNDTPYYANSPLVVGMYESQLNKLTPEFIKDFDEYTEDKKFGVAFLGTELPQMRTIPIAKSIQPQHNVSTFDEMKALLQKAQPPFVIFSCICREKTKLEGEPCQVTDREETCFAVGGMAQSVLRKGIGREITLDESLSILEKNQNQGLVMQPSNSEKAEFICSCCGCCCGMLKMHKTLPIPVDFWATNFYARVDTEACDGCGNCEKRCQVGAATLSDKTQLAAIHLNRCIGCGLCIPTCPQNALSLEKKHREVRPPQTREDLHDIIMARKKGRLGKLKVTGKLIVDAIKTGQTHLLK